MNATPDPTVYADPCPGMKGADKVWDVCGNCGGDGLYHAPSGYTWKRGKSAVAMPYCFGCMGSGGRHIKVSSLRARVRAAANQAKRDRDHAPMRAWLAAEAFHHKFLRDVEAAYREQERREALPKGFLGQPGDKLTAADKLCGVVTVAHHYDAPGPYGRTIYGVMLVIVLDDGRVAKWSSGSDAAYDRKVGDKVRILKAIVKGHTTFRGQDQTDLKNVRLELLEAEKS